MENGGLTLSIRLSIIKASLERVLGAGTALDGVTLYKTGNITYLKAVGSRGEDRIMVAVQLLKEGDTLYLAPDAETHYCESSCFSCEFFLDVELHISGCQCGGSPTKDKTCKHSVRTDVASSLVDMLSTTAR